MTAPVIISMVFGFMGFVVGITTLLTFASNRRKTAVEEGKHLATIEELRRDLDHACDKIRTLENEARENDKRLAEMQTDIKHILKTLEEVKRALNKKTGECV